MTIWPAWQHFEEVRKGTLELGKLADLVVLSRDPLPTPDNELAAIEVVATNKDSALVSEKTR